MTVATQYPYRKLIQEDRVHRTLFTDPEIFELEMDRIHGRIWLYVAHESQVPNPGDFFCTYLGRQPVIVSRHVDGNIHVFYNRCAHRGVKVCNRVSGNVKRFQCMYHGWTYGTDGALEAVSLKNGYSTDLDFSKIEFGMLAVSRVDTYRGFVFASASPEGPTLDAFLSNIKSSIDDLVDRAPGGELDLTAGAHRYIVHANWKVQLENVNDLYHPPFAHSSTVRSDGRQFGRRGGEAGSKARITKSDGSLISYFDEAGTWAFDYGHSYCGPLLFEEERSDPVYLEYKGMLEQQYGSERTREVLKLTRHNSIFYPNMAIQSLAQNLRVIRPLSVDRTEVTVYPVLFKHAPKQFNQELIRFLNLTHGAAAPIQADDIEVFKRAQIGFKVDRAEWILLARDLGNEIPVEGGGRKGMGTSELVQRNQYRAWLQYMEGA